MSTPVQPSGPDDQLELAIADLSGRVQADAAQISVVVDEAVMWPDGSIGCPRPGMNYTQALVPGRRIVLQHAGVPYAYHATDDGEPFLCPIGRAVSPAPRDDI